MGDSVRRARPAVLCALFFFALFLTLWGAGAPEARGAPLDSERQEALAREYLFQLSRTPADEREALFLRLIVECPATEAAEEAHWDLSDFYLDDVDEPQEEKARKILEEFLKRYPSSQWRPHVESRLEWLKDEKTN